MESCDKSLENRVTALEVQVNALDRLTEAQSKLAMQAVATADVKINERFASHNEFREQIREERSNYVTRDEVRWLVGIVIALVFSVLGLFMRSHP
jgi:transcriptional accessory protein Tex/SPT6